MFDSILVVCVGNICRSPTAERLLQNSLPERKISSAGLAAVVGHGADATALLVAKSNGLSLDGHHARQLTRELCREQSLILVMEKSHIEAVTRLAPEVRGKRCCLLTGLNSGIFLILTERVKKHLSLFIVY